MKTTRPSPSFIVAALALMLAMGGVGYAAGSLPKNSVGTKQLKNNAVKTSKIKNGTVTGADIDERTLARPGVTGSLVLSGHHFVPNNPATTVINHNHGGVTVTGSNTFITTDLDVPAGATVTNIEVYFLDNDADDLYAFVKKYTPSSATGAAVGPDGFSAGMSPSVQTMTIAPDFLVDAVSDYRLLVDLPASPNLVLYGAKVSYVRTARLD